MRVLVLRAAGTNCDRETAYAFEKVGAKAESRHVNELLADPRLLHAYRILVIPGGFSYGDDVAAGRVLATEMKDRGQKVTLTDNVSHRYEDRWVELSVPTDRCVFVERGESYYFPIAHAEGKFVAPDATLDALEENCQVVFRYGKNPNGSMRDIAGICDVTGRVLGLMPHPERHLEPWHHPYWTREGLAEEGDGLRLFRKAVAAVTQA
ncbi:MAG: phosphoribosylformylglycinamidine synthase subunit PurQ [Planctomycetota bacterium]